VYSQLLLKKIRELSMRIPEDDINMLGKCLQPVVAQTNQRVKHETP